jgi:hypothetical protein
LHGEKPLVHYLHTFGYVAHVKQGSKHLGKLEDRNTLMVFIRYEPGSKAWRFYNPVTLCVHVSRDAIFEEDRVWDWSEEDIGMVNRSGWSCRGWRHVIGYGRHCMARLASGHSRDRLTGKIFTRECNNAHA